jgi:regulatory protein
MIRNFLAPLLSFYGSQNRRYVFSKSIDEIRYRRPMPTITKVTEQRRRPNRRNVHLDGVFAFGCNVNVIARFRLREGMALNEEQVLAILEGEVRQECFDHALRFLQMRFHSRSQLIQKLNRREYGPAIVLSVADQLKELGYLDDERFARAKAASAAGRKKQGRRRAKIELMKAGIRGSMAETALDHVYGRTDSTAIARELAQQQSARLSKLDPAIARRRLTGMLQRRGFDFATIAPLVREIFGEANEMDDLD